MTAEEARRIVAMAASMRSFDWLEVRDAARAALEPRAHVPVDGQMSFADALVERHAGEAVA